MRAHGREQELTNDHVAVLLKSPVAPAYAPATPQLLTRRRPSVQFDPLPKPPQLSALHVKRGPRRTTRCVGIAVLTALGVVVLLLVKANTRGSEATTTWYGDRGRSCEARGLFTPAGNDDAQRVVVRVAPRQSALTGGGAFVRENTVQARPFHPVLSSQAAELFAGGSKGSAASPPENTPAGECIRPAVHVLDFKARPVLAADQKSPELFFALCTSPKRAVRYAQTWSHFMLDRTVLMMNDNAPPPGCLVTDAQNTHDHTGMSRANDEFRRHGLGCVMRDTSRTGQRYEARVLGLLRDAWVESELRRWRDGAAVPDWFVFGDDDTWYSDPTMLRAFLARHDPAEEHFFGAFSEARQNYEYFGRIAFGGAGIVISRALLEKMQARVDECTIRFKDVVGGDGMISNCAALCRDYPLSEIVEEIPGLRQMDIQGDATGYLTDGSAPFLSLHHWTSWLQLIPGVPDLEAIGLLSSAASALGGPNLLRRWVFDGGAVTWSAGYAVTVHRSALTVEQLRQVEWTWNDHAPRKPARPRLTEGVDKVTYYIADVKEVEPRVYLFRHTCSDPTAAQVVREIDILWDARGLEDNGSATKVFLGSWRRLLGRLA
ncbi:hypothetical protein JCM3774_005396 [Rhodotorula dairenensis]